MRRNILMVDNYDSFTYNIVHYLESIDGIHVDVFRNDMLDGLDMDLYNGVVLSPGPGLPEESGELMPFTKSIADNKAILGICLGLQTIVECFGGSLINMDSVLHGRQTKILISPDENSIFKDLTSPIEVGRYHSWVADSNHLPSSLRVLAWDEQNRIMAVKHESLPIYALQFHPESIMSPDGLQIIKNWVELL